MLPRQRWTIATVGVFILVVSFVFGISATRASGPNGAAIDSAKSIGETRANAPANAVAAIGDRTITRADFEEAVGSVRANLAYMQGEIKAGSSSSDYLQEFVDTINAHGVENAALGSLIEKQAVYELAVQRGLDPSDEAVAKKVKADKELVANAGVDAAAAKAYIAAVGEQRYWSELYPAIARRELATQALWTSITQKISDYAGKVAAQKAIEKEAVDAASVTVLNADAIAPATLADALSYLKDYWALSAEG